MIPIQDLIDKELTPTERIRSGKFNPSYFGMCFRAQFWNRKNEKQSNPSSKRDLRVLRAGTLFHDFVEGIITKNNGVMQREVKVECDDIIGFADLVREDEVIDLKSQHSKSFWWMDKAEKSKGFDIKAEKYNNWLQVGYYARELGKHFMRLVFLSKDDLCVKEYVQPLDEYWRKELDNEIYALRYLWTQSALPEAKPRRWGVDKKTGEPKECSYCKFKDTCFKLQGKIK